MGKLDQVPTILLSAGHHPGASGAHHEDLAEHDVVSGIAFYLAGEIGKVEMEIQVVMVPTGHLADKILWVNEWCKRWKNDPCFAVELHLDSWHESAVHGISVFHEKRDFMTGEMGKAVLKGVARPSWPSRGLKFVEDSNLGSLAWIGKTSMPALLVEVGFITNRAEREYLRTDAGQHSMGIRLASGLVDAALFMYSFTNEDKPGGKGIVRGDHTKDDWRMSRIKGGR